MSKPAPAGAQGVHVNPEARGNVSGDYSLAFNDASGDLECDSAPESPLVGDPIDVHSGTFYLEEHDIGVATGCADMSLRFVRTYRHGAPSTGSLGPGWTHNFEMRVITAKNDYVMVQRPRGSLLIFQDVGGDVYASRADSSWSLLKCSEGGWILAHRDRRAEVYDAQGRLTALQDANGNQMWMTYETVTRNGATTTRLARVDAPGGRFLWFGYDYYRPGRIIVVGDNADRRMRFGYDDNKAYDFIDDGVLVSATDATGAVSTYTDATDSWRMLKKTDALGRDVFVNEYDASGRVIRQQLNTGQDLRLSYTVITDTAEIQNRLGAAEAQGLHALLETTVQDQAGSASYTFGSDGLLRLMTDPAGATTRYQQYTAARKPGVIVDALGRTTRMAYNERGQVVRITDALSQTTQIEYDRWGLPTRLTGQGQSYDMQYNGPRLIEVRDQNGQHMSFGYSDQAGWKNVLTSMQHSGSLTTTLTLNTAGDVTELRDALGRSTRLQYDAAGRLTQRTDPRGSVTTLTYDAADRVIQVDQAADGQTRTTRATYNAVGDPLTLTDALGHTARFGPDDAGRVISQTLADGRQLDVRFDPRSNLTGLTPPDRGMHAFRFTPVNLIQQYQPPTLPDGSNTPTQYAYDLAQQLTTLTRPDGSALTFQYDALGRPISITHRDGVTSLQYDSVTRQLTRLSAPDAALAVDYDAALRPTAFTWSGAVNGTVGWQYDPLGCPSRETVGDQAPISLAYDASGAPTHVGAATLTYTATGDLHAIQIDQSSETWRHNGFGEPIHQTARINGQDVLTANTSRDALGRVMTSTTTLSGATTTDHYTYDATGRLTSSTRDGQATTYTYDTNNNRTATTQPDGSVIAAAYDSQDRLLTWGATTYTHTANGARATRERDGQTTSYAYDANGNLNGVTLPDGTRLRYLLDGLGRRMGVQVNGVFTQGFLYADDLRPVAELDGSGQIVSQFVYASRANVPDYMRRGGQTYRVLSDERGSVRLVLDAATGQIAQQLDYDAWGGIIQDSNPGFQPFGFAGGLYDQRTGLTHFGAREYDAATGRWLQKDPIGFDGGDSNLYAYVGNDPVNYIDPTGLSALDNLPLRRMLGAYGGAIGGLGVVAGLMLARGPAGFMTCFFADKLYIDLLVGIGVGALAGYMLPAFTGLRAAMLAGMAFNALQYTTTEALHNRNPLADGGRGLAWSLVGGLAGGLIGGPFKPNVTYRGRLPVEKLPPHVTWKRALADFRPSLRFGALLRLGTAVLAANWPSSGPGSMEGCQCSQ